MKTLSSISLNTWAKFKPKQGRLKPKQNQSSKELMTIQANQITTCKHKTPKTNLSYQ